MSLHTCAHTRMDFIFSFTNMFSDSLVLSESAARPENTFDLMSVKGHRLTINTMSNVM